jgi:hypothetical protein
MEQNLRPDHRGQNDEFCSAARVDAGVPKAWLRYDVIAGLTAAVVVIPKAMAYATIAGLPVQVDSTPPCADGDLLLVGTPGRSA